MIVAWLLGTRTCVTLDSPRSVLLAVRKTCRIVTCFYINYSDTQFIFTHVRLVDPLSSCPIGRSLEIPSDDGTALEGVGKILAMEDLEFPVLLDKSVGEDSIVVESGSEDGRGQSCGLGRCHFLWPGTM